MLPHPPTPEDTDQTSAITVTPHRGSSPTVSEGVLGNADDRGSSPRVSKGVVGNTDTDYNANASWSGNVAPGLGDVAQFTVAEVTQPKLSASISNAGLAFTTTGSTGYDLTNTTTEALTLTGQTNGSAGQSSNSN